MVKFVCKSYMDLVNVTPVLKHEGSHEANTHLAQADETINTSTEVDSLN